MTTVGSLNYGATRICKSTASTRDKPTHIAARSTTNQTPGAGGGGGAGAGSADGFGAGAGAGCSRSGTGPTHTAAPNHPRPDDEQSYSTQFGILVVMHVVVTTLHSVVLFFGPSHACVPYTHVFRF